MPGEKIFNNAVLNEIFPRSRSDDFFEALYGDAEEGAYDIRLAFHGRKGENLNFSLELHERPGKCLACNLTYGLPEVFSRHPVINIEGLVKEIAERLKGKVCSQWQLGATEPVNKKIYRIPLTITLDS